MQRSTIEYFNNKLQQGTGEVLSKKQYFENSNMKMKTPVTSATSSTNSYESAPPSLMEEMMKEAQMAKLRHFENDCRETSTSKSQNKLHFKKGFLSNDPAAPTKSVVQTAQRKKGEKPCFSNQDPNCLAKEWITPSLLQTIHSNPILHKGMTNPKFTTVLHALSTNPNAAMDQFRQDEDVMDYFHEFCAVMGSHFDTLGQQQLEAKKQQQQPLLKHLSSTRTFNNSLKQRHNVDGSSFHSRAAVVSQERVDYVLQQKKLRDLLLDVELQRIIQDCSTQPDKLHQVLRHSEYGHKIRMLINAGLLKIV